MQQNKTNKYRCLQWLLIENVYTWIDIYFINVENIAKETNIALFFDFCLWMTHAMKM